MRTDSKVILIAKTIWAENCCRLSVRVFLTANDSRGGCSRVSPLQFACRSRGADHLPTTKTTQQRLQDDGWKQMDIVCNCLCYRAIACSLSASHPASFFLALTVSHSLSRTHTHTQTPRSLARRVCLSAAPAPTFARFGFPTLADYKKNHTLVRCCTDCEEE